MDVYRYYATLPAGAQAYAPRSADSALLRYSADECLKILTTRKHAANKTFLARLIRISDENVRRCLALH